MTLGESFRSPRSSTALFIATLLLLSPAANGQSKPLTSAVPTPTKRDSLKLFVLEGAGVSNFIPDGVGKMVVVEVRDENDLPLEGVDVMFELPQTGAGGQFADGSLSRSVKTDLRGQTAISFNLRPEQGPFQIKVTASIGDRRGGTVISQLNSLKPVEDKPHKKHHWYTSKTFLITAAATGVAVGIILAVRGSSSSSGGAPGTITITPGGPVFGGPQ